MTQDRSGACAVARRGGNEQRSSETTHAGSLSGVSCTDDRIATYLLTGALPTRLSGDRSDVQCEPVPPPDPASAASAAAAKAGSGATLQDRLPADLRRIITRASTGG